MSWGAVIAAAGTAYAGYSANEAADEQANAAAGAGRVSQRQYEQTERHLAPYRIVGDQALGRISRVLGLGGAAPDMSEFQADPGYQFRLNEGNKALDRSAAGRGMLLSGAQLKSLGRYNQGMASQEFGNWFNRLYGLAGMGQNAAVQAGGFGQANAANQANYGLMAGNARAVGIEDRANVVGGGLEQLAGMLPQRSSGYDSDDKLQQPDYAGNTMPYQANNQYGGYT